MNKIQLPFNSGVNVLITTPDSSLRNLVRLLANCANCLVVDMDGVVTSLLSEVESGCSVMLSSLKLSETVANSINFTRDISVVFFFSLNTLAEESRYIASKKGWMMAFYKNLLLVSSAYQSLVDKVCFVHLIPGHAMRRLLNSWQLKIYRRLGTVWIYNESTNNFEIYKGNN